jgi:hypothetical protein
VSEEERDLKELQYNDNFVYGEIVHESLIKIFTWIADYEKKNFLGTFVDLGSGVGK